MLFFYLHCTALPRFQFPINMLLVLAQGRQLLQELLGVQHLGRSICNLLLDGLALGILVQVLVLHIVASAHHKHDRFLERCPCPGHLGVRGSADLRVKVKKILVRLIRPSTRLHDRLNDPGHGQVFLAWQKVLYSRQQVLKSTTQSTRSNVV